MTIDELPVEGPKLPTAKERQAAARLAKQLREARILLRENGHAVFDRVGVVEYFGPHYYKGYFGAPAPTVRNDGTTLHPVRLVG